jgi:uncharacterized protein (DUF1800 family)
MAKNLFDHIKSGVCLVVLAFALPAHAAETTTPPATDAQILHLLNRITFGPAPGDIELVRHMGIQGYIEQQLHPSTIPPSISLNGRLAQLPTLTMSMADLESAYVTPEADRKMMSEDERKESHKREREIDFELSEAKILRAVMSPAQLQEVMTDFWFNHFNVYDTKGLDKVATSSYERDAIRPYALGKFSDLLLATASHPAMLVYLDNDLNTAPNSAGAKGKKIGINENYAREVMELHTLGVNGGYTQEDVTTLAHILTGWGLGDKGMGRTSFYFDPRRHDFNNQVFLGTQIRGGGVEEVTYVLNMLAHLPATAHHISYELAQYFVADEPPESLVNKMATTFQSSDGDITAVLQTMFFAPEFWEPKYTQVKFKPPFRYIVSAIRAAHVVPSDDTKNLQGLLKEMGEPLYHYLTPNGYANTNDQWLNSDALLKRISFAQMLDNYLDTNSAALIESALGQNWSANTLATVQKAESKLQPALLLSSPEFVYY